MDESGFFRRKWNLLTGSGCTRIKSWRRPGPVPAAKKCYFLIIIKVYKTKPAGGSQLLIEKPLRIQEVSVRSAGEENFGSVVEVPVPLPGAGGCLLRGVGAVDRCERVLI